MRTVRRALKEVLLRGPLTRPLLLRAVIAVAMALTNAVGSSSALPLRTVYALTDADESLAGSDAMAVPSTMSRFS